jgi:hypothetical protein
MKNAVKRDLQPHRRVKVQGHQCSLLWRSGGCGYGILAVEFIYESLRNIHVVSSINNRNARGINDQVDVVCFCERVERSTNIFLQRSKQLSLSFGIGCLGILALALDIFF